MLSSVRLTDAPIRERGTEEGDGERGKVERASSTRAMEKKATVGLLAPLISKTS